MGAWADLSLSAATLKGMAPVDMMDPDFGEYDTDRLTTDYEQQAKEYIESRLIGIIPEMIVHSEGPEKFMDAAVAITNVANLIQQVLGRSFLFHYYGNERYGTADLFAEKRKEQKELFEEVFSAFVSYIRRDEDFIDQLETTSDQDMDEFMHPIWVG